MEVARDVMSQPVYRAMQFLRGPVEKVGAKPAANDPNVVNVAVDSLFVAIAKLGGLNRAEIAGQWGAKPEEFKDQQPVFGKPLARVDGGLAIDAMAERLLEFGYLTPDEAGRADARQFEDAFFSELSGTKQFSIAADYGFMAAARTDAEEEAAARALTDEQLARMVDWQGGRLDLDAMKLRFGDAADAAWRKLGTGTHGMVRSDGLPPELVAEFFGFTSADHLVTEILQAVPPRERIQAETDQRMMERYGDLVDPQQVALAVDQAVHNEARGRFVAMELQALQRATNVRQGRVDVLAQQAKAYAQQALAALRIRDIRPGKYTAAEGKAARASAAALKAGDSALAATEKRNQLLHHHTARAAADVLEEVEKGVAYLRKFDREGTRKGLDIEYVEQIDALLERFDLRAISNKAADRRASLQAWIESQRAQGLEPSIPDALLDEAYRQPYRNLTVEEFRGLIDSVKQIEHLGRLKKRLLTARDQREYEAIRDEIAASVIANAGERQADTRTPVTWTGRMRQMGRRFVAAHLKVATLANVMDGGKDGGPVWEHFVRGANERGDMETTMRAEATQRLTEILAPVFKLGRMGGSGTYFASIQRSLNREQRIAIALNTGNAGNLQRLLGGEGWTQAQIQPVLDSLTAAEWRAVQEVWDHLETYRPLIAAKERRVYGKEPDWVEAVPRVQRTADGVEMPLRGGYFPVKYDPAASIRAEENSDADAAKQQLQGAYTSATTRRSFTKQRAQEVKGRPLLYNLSGVYSGVNDVIHDLAWHEWLIDVNRLLKSQTIDAAIREHYGPEAKAQFKSWVQDIAEGDNGAQNAGEQMLSRLRQGVSAAGLGFNVMSAIIQITGFNQSIVRIGAGWVGQGIARTIANPIAAAREVNEKSEFMRNRARTRFRELNELRNRVEDQSGVMRAIQANSYFLMMRVQKMVDIPTWLGAHAKALASGETEAKAVALADQAVIDAQGGGQTKDLSAIERGGPALKLFTVYYSFMNTAFNMAARSAMTADTPAKKARAAVDMLMIFTVPAVLGAVLKDALTPGGDDEDDPEALARKLAAEQLSYMMGSMVIVRELSYLAKEVTGAEGARFGYEGPAGLRALTDLGKLTKQAAQGEFDDAFRKAAINVLGDLTGLPAAQINRTITGTQALAEGETDNPAAVVLGFQR